ncbi:Hsp70 family protein (plasmid) [Escherichia coli]|nr:Hsp70 family protein [Escherichia coli]
MQNLPLVSIGTTNSLIAVWKDGAAQLIPNKFGEYLTPSIISMDENNHICSRKTGCITADFASG